MKNYFNIQEKRSVISHLTHHINPSRHPDRILTEHYFLYMLEGGWGIGQNGINHEVLPDDVLIMPAGGHHYAVSDTLPMTKYIWILASVADGDCYSDIPDISDNISYSRKYVSLDTKISCRGYEEPKELFHKIALESLAKSKYFDIKLSSLFNVLLCELSAINNNTATAGSDNLFNRALCIMSEHPEKFYKIKELAAFFSVAEKTIRNTFLRHTGESVHEYQLKKKIDIIKTRIKLEPNLKMKTICKEYGFCDEFHLSRIFKKYAGVSPTDYKFTL
ncbi:MAG: AraC family transcriptional regulator [Oscillospiraceae bacterium]|nr:AraC family transcriptional regulator [Oscillospiraceae bacterium]